MVFVLQNEPRKSKIGMALAWNSGMLSSMKPLKNCLALLAGVLLAGGSATRVSAEASSNPYKTIIVRNAFGLKDPPPPQAPPPVVAPTPTVKVILTGISTIVGTRALLEITEQEPGKTATTRKPVMREGDSDGGVEVISIDVVKSLVRIRSGGSETNLSFETPKLTGTAPGAAPAAGSGFIPAPPPATAAAGVPAIFSPMNAAPDHPTRSSSVTVFGSSGSTAGLGGGGNGNFAASGFGAPGRGTAAYGPSVYGGAGVNLSEGAGGVAIPARTLRTDTSAPTAPAAPAAPVDLAKQYLEMALDHEIHSAGGSKLYPPLPPMPTR